MLDCLINCTIIDLCHTYRDSRKVNGWNKNRIFLVEKRISVFIGRTIFLLVKNYCISVLIGYTVFLTSEENRIVILLTTWPHWRRQGGGARGAHPPSMSWRTTPVKRRNPRRNWGGWGDDYVMSNAAPRVMQCRKGIVEAQDDQISIEINDEPRTATKSHVYVNRIWHNGRARHRKAGSRFCGYISEKNEFSMTIPYVSDALTLLIKQYICI